jgi:16S rRNA (cytosine1402-N4)-methyltransferase
VERWAAKPVETSAELASIVLASIPKKFHVKNIHPATRVFQAVRIEVNRELQSIEDGLKGGFKMLSEGGIMMAISFHSLEDRIAKIFFRRMKDGCLCGEEPNRCNCMNKPFAELLTKKPVMADDDELRWNNRSGARSSGLKKVEKYLTEYI